MPQLCECGCGEETRIASSTNARYGHVKGEPVRYVKGHYWRNKRRSTGPESAHWKGGKRLDKRGYVMVCVGKDHPMAAYGGYVREHRLVVAENIGRNLEPHEVVHHINGDKTDNRIGNLVLFSGQSEHRLHHLELAAIGG